MFIKIFLLLFFCSLTVCCGAKQRKQSLSQELPPPGGENAVNINTASPEELEQLPEIGKRTAEAIILHRERFGQFKRKEHLMLVPKISEKRFRKIQHLIKVE